MVTVCRAGRPEPHPAWDPPTCVQPAQKPQRNDLRVFQDSGGKTRPPAAVRCLTASQRRRCYWCGSHLRPAVKRPGPRRARDRQFVVDRRPV